MSDYAVIAISGRQFKVTTGSKITIDNTDTEAGKTLKIESVLLRKIGDKLEIGEPNLSGVTLTAKVLEKKKGDKIRVSKFKAKSRYRKTIGFRSKQVILEIEDIAGREKEVSSPAKKTSKRLVNK